ncbi:G5 domain-containing protein [Micromonospora sp. C32]|uniref:G5 domain-containing protein n=1 Tax=Micromonospora sp. C32 TaxID=2824877 RepID=UPI0027DE8850|nr:G5 domain-containing protein [Micromonospora sp. C32]
MSTHDHQQRGGNLRSIIVSATILAVLGFGAVAVNAVTDGEIARGPAPAPASSTSGATRIAATDAAKSSPAVTPSRAVVETLTVTATEPVPYRTKKVKDSSMPKGITKLRTRGVEGTRTLTYQVTVIDGVETARKVVKTQVTTKPVTEVVAVGTKNCDLNYQGCVPIASDVDCAGGSGNGPAYVKGPVKVIGYDIYKLDRNNDGYGCDE